MRNSRIYKLALFAMLVALAFVFGWLESMVPNPLEAIAPGIKLGLANIVVLVALYCLGALPALAISLLRVVLSAFTFGSLTMMFYSLSGALLAYFVMFLLKKSGHFSPVGVSTAGGVAHNIGQILIAMLTLGSNLLYYLPFLLVGGILSGIVIGLLGALVLLRLKRVPAPHD